MKYYLTTLVLLITLRVSAQLSVGNEGITILSGTTLTVDGLALTPSTNLTIANNTIQRTSTPIAGDPSINRLYQFSTPIIFSGTAGINYLTSELNGFTESTLQLAYAPAANTTLTVTTSSTVNTTTHYVSNTLTNQPLFILTAKALSDLTPLLYARPTTVSNTSDVTLVVDVIEINSVAATGTFTVRVTKDPKVVLTFSPSATRVGNRAVQNSAWTLSSTNPNYYTLTPSQGVAAGDILSFGLTGRLSPGATAGVISISSIILPETLTEARLNNNSDSDKIEYFQQ